MNALVIRIGEVQTVELVLKPVLLMQMSPRVPLVHVKVFGLVLIVINVTLLHVTVPMV